MDKALTKIWEVQRDFQKNFYDLENLSEEDKLKFTKEFILSMHRELGEVLNEIPWKLHRANSDDYSVDHVQEELIDVQKFLLNLFLIWGMNPDTFYDLFMKKSAIVQARYDSEKGNI